MKRLFAAISLVAIAACSAPPSSSIVPSSSDPTAANTARHFTISDLFVPSDAAQNNSRPEKSGGIAIKSFGIDGTINGQKVQGYVKAKCTALDKGGFATGCALRATSTLTISKLTVGIFTGAKATGCLVAVGKYSGTVPSGQTVPVKLKWTGKCK